MSPPSTALLFAGQATQYVGMGRALYDRFPEARAVFAAADEALGEALSAIIFEGPEASLNLTENTQPAVLTVACAAWAVLDARGFSPAVVAGHSLGEYGALVVAGALTLADAVRLCRRRGRYMQSAVPLGAGAMAAVLRADDAAIAAACAAVDGVCVPAVFNAPRITVISGEAAAVAAVSEALAAERAVIKPLTVSAPFHCPLLSPAAEQLAGDLAAVPIAAPTLPYVRNIDAAWVEPGSAEADPTRIRQTLVEQVVGAVRWRSSIAAMLERGVERYWHLGPGRTNISHVKKQARKAPTASLDRADDLDAIVAELEGA